jgi:hypothetical protein
MKSAIPVSEPYSPNISRYVQWWLDIPYNGQLAPIKIVLSARHSIDD